MNNQTPSYRFKKNELTNLVKQDLHEIFNVNLLDLFKKNYGETWAKTPPERRIPAIIGMIAQQGFSKEAAQDYENYNKTLYQGAKSMTSPFTALLPKRIRDVFSGAAVSKLIDPGLEAQLPSLASAASFDPRVLALKT